MTLFIYLTTYERALFNSQLLLILFTNFTLFTLGTALFVDDESVAEIINDERANIENDTQAVVIAENSRSAIEFQFTPVAPPPLVIEKKENRQEIKRLLQEKQKSAEERGLLQAQLALALQQNNRLEAQINHLEGEVETRSSQIAALEKNNRELQTSIRKKPAEIASDIDLLKTTIQSQPDLIEHKSVEKKDPPGEQNLPIIIVAQPDDFSGSVEFGFSYEQDNKVTRAINGRLVLDYEQASRYKFNSNFKFEMSDEDGEKSAEKYRWQLQGDYYLDLRNLVFARSDIKRNQFASYEKEDIYTVGYGRILFDENRHKFNMEIGPGYRMAVPNDGKNALSVDEFIVRTRFNYERVVSESLQLMASTVWEMGKENSIYSVNLKAQNKIYRELYLIFDFDYKYMQNVPIDTLNKEVSTGLKLLYAF
ncbi:MAG: putative salt-induced outer membrane protein YdiY [Psychromonas sp.]|uniref:DUF481 domain-containing protein n=1 Tax=Psychromonas sp. TaxID=1884585 RepID=UPI0039E6E6D5